MLSYLKQIQYPKEFQIPPPPSDLWECFDRILLHMASSQTEEKEWIHFLREMGIGVWRVRHRLTSVEHPPREVESAKRFLGSVFDALLQFGVQIQDHTGDRLTGGETLQIVSCETVGYITEEQVIETIKPTITFKGRIIQVGEVIVGRPERQTHHESLENRLVRV